MKRRQHATLMTIAVLVIAGATVSLWRLSVALPRLHPEILLAHSLSAPKTSPTYQWPKQGQAAIIMQGLTRRPVGETPDERPVPVASLAKLMTAYLILQDHPLSLGSTGPTLTISIQDLESYNTDVTEDQSSIQVRVGEKLTEYQLLQALLVRSANNVADILANWDAGSLPAFVNKMNQTARELGMSKTHFADASGFNPATVSTASDIALIAARNMRNPIFNQLVNEHEVTLPIVGTLPNIVNRIGTGGIIGIKSGYTIWSGGCAAIATKENTPAGSEVAISVVLDQQGGGSLHHAATEGATLNNDAKAGVVKFRAMTSMQTVGYLIIPWIRGNRRVSLIAARGVTLTLWSNQRVLYKFQPKKLNSGMLPKGTVVGLITIKSPMQTTLIPAVTKSPIPGPSLWWKLQH
ncbi:MAG: D-alanyl-D-alanine carboxypeptidase family protein [Ferrimicrobium sp.]